MYQRTTVKHPFFVFNFPDQHFFKRRWVDVKNYYMQFFVPEKRTSAKNFQLLEEMYVLGNCLIRLKCVQ